MPIPKAKKDREKYFFNVIVKLVLCQMVTTDNQCIAMSNIYASPLPW